MVKVKKPVWKVFHLPSETEGSKIAKASKMRDIILAQRDPVSVNLFLRNGPYKIITLRRQFEQLPPFAEAGSTMKSFSAKEPSAV